MRDFERQNPRKLTARQQRAISALLTEPTTRAAAVAANVSEATIFRWLADPDFDAAYREARARLIEDALTILQAATTDAAKYLRSLVLNEAAPTYARLTAAKNILELALRSRELEIAERLDALESLLRVRGPR